MHTGQTRELEEKCHFMPSLLVMAYKAQSLVSAPHTATHKRSKREDLFYFLLAKSQAIGWRRRERVGGRSPLPPPPPSPLFDDDVSFFSLHATGHL